MYNFIIHISLVYLYLRWVFGLPLSMTMVRPPLLPQRLPNSSLRKSSVLILQNLSTWQEVTRKLPGSKKRDQKGQSVRIFLGCHKCIFELDICNMSWSWPKFLTVRINDQPDQSMSTKALDNWRSGEWMFCIEWPHSCQWPPKAQQDTQLFTEVTHTEQLFKGTRHSATTR